MSWQNEIPADDPELEAPADEAGDEEETPDPNAWLEEVDDETRARIDALAQARAEAAAQETEKRFRAGLGRWGNAHNHLKQLGIDVADDGAVVVRDPQALAKLTQAPQAAAQPEKPKTPPPPDPAYEPEAFAAWANERAREQAQALLADELAPLRQQLEQLQGQTRMQAFPAVTETARTALDAYGLGQFADHPEFGRVFQQAVQQLPPDQWGNEVAVQTAALSIVPTLRMMGEPAPAPRPNPAAVAANVHRQGLGATTPSRPATRAQPQRFSAETVEGARTLGISPEEYEALGDSDSARTYYSRSSRRGGR